MRLSIPQRWFYIWITITFSFVHPTYTQAGVTWNRLIKADDKPGGKASSAVRLLRKCSLCLFNQDNFDPDKVRVVDQQNENIILRMPNPSIDGEFRENKLYDAIRTAVPSWKGPDDSEIVVFNLMHRWAEFEEYVVEKSWFDAHPEHKFKYFPQLGSLLPSTWVPGLLRKLLYKWDRHLLLRARVVVDALHDELSTLGEKPKIIILHCVSGRDRTGFIDGLYQMTYNEKSYESVVKVNQEVAGKPQDFYSRNSLRWEALRLIEEGYSHVGEKQAVLDYDDKDTAYFQRQLSVSKKQKKH
ncbi:hypothetical protein M3P05_00040 [Sansalvadorimonas sp. 2012CJ34-2]|uniref:Tyrosine specific protein phosphatases domain-containing protein n=1 Tax=Parendozoicomonas callyspongiae TaxID=2942213 RepID=A0ABT0PAA1_9GAMM|nr:hypothetical protein [Sansalvadorimonas sp. 2012CJ34-2]MCL6268339.1 hypothetical protein [Sansalvadorimonas sp. 2012CJ34-2]